MVKIYQTGLLKLNFETRPKKQGWVVIPQNVKKVKITAP
jgi:hypothetical protein